MTNSKVSIIILNWNKLAYTKNCIASIEENTLYPNYEVILFDNGSTEPGTDEFLSRTKLTVIRSPQNLGFSIGNNRAAAAADGDLLLFLNNDTIVHKNWLEPMVTMLKAYPNCGIVGSRLLYPDSTIQHIRVAFDHKGNCVHPFKRYPADIPEAVRPAECEAVTGACMLMRSEERRVGKEC
jgi:GT2 family glycosyltransferase